MSKPIKNENNDEERALRLNQFYRDLNKLVGYNRKYVNGRASKSSNGSSPNGVGISRSAEDVSAETSRSAGHSTGSSLGNGMTVETSESTGDLHGNSKDSGIATGTSLSAGKSAALSHDPKSKGPGYYSY